jgi:hypothetical protein
MGSDNLRTVARCPDMLEEEVVLLSTDRRLLLGFWSLPSSLELLRRMLRLLPLLMLLLVLPPVEFLLLVPTGAFWTSLLLVLSLERLRPPVLEEA